MQGDDERSQRQGKEERKREDCMNANKIKRRQCPQEEQEEADKGWTTFVQRQ